MSINAGTAAAEVMEDVAVELGTLFLHNVEAEAQTKTAYFPASTKTAVEKLWLVLTASPTKASHVSDVNFLDTISTSVYIVHAQVLFQCTWVYFALKERLLTFH